uniref:Phospholipase A2 n=1 Tax=Steinernema glaseri TaxID=37863 RepID=A0A1I7ZIF0_9BILA
MKVLFCSIALFLAVVLLVSVSGEDYCLIGKHKAFARTWTLGPMCSSQKDTINGCCRNHDYCYDAQAGRFFCDDRFCSCLRNAMSPETDGSCRNTTRYMCFAVHTYGYWQYEKAGKN